MPAATTDHVQAAQDQTLKTIRDGQQAFVGMVGTWADTVEKLVPATPALPFASELPKPQELVRASFGFAEQLLKAQREFAENLFAAAAPVLDPKPAGTPSAPAATAPAPAVTTPTPAATKPAPAATKPAPAAAKPAPAAKKP